MNAFQTSNLQHSMQTIQSFFLLSCKERKICLPQDKTDGAEISSVRRDIKIKDNTRREALEMTKQHAELCSLVWGMSLLTFPSNIMKQKRATPQKKNILKYFRFSCVSCCYLNKPVHCFLQWSCLKRQHDKIRGVQRRRLGFHFQDVATVFSFALTACCQPSNACWSCTVWLTIVSLYINKHQTLELRLLWGCSERVRQTEAGRGFEV